MGGERRAVPGHAHAGASLTRVGDRAERRVVAFGAVQRRGRERAGVGLQHAGVGRARVGVVAHLVGGAAPGHRGAGGTGPAVAGVPGGARIAVVACLAVLAAVALHLQTAQPQRVVARHLVGAQRPTEDRDLVDQAVERIVVHPIPEADLQRPGRRVEGGRRLVRHRPIHVEPNGLAVVRHHEVAPGPDHSRRRRRGGAFHHEPGVGQHDREVVFRRAPPNQAQRLHGPGIVVEADPQLDRARRTAHRQPRRSGRAQRRRPDRDRVAHLPGGALRDRSRQFQRVALTRVVRHGRPVDGIHAPVRHEEALAGATRHGIADVVRAGIVIGAVGRVVHALSGRAEVDRADIVVVTGAHRARTRQFGVAHVVLGARIPVVARVALDLAPQRSAHVDRHAVFGLTNRAGVETQRSGVAQRRQFVALLGQLRARPQGRERGLIERAARVVGGAPSGSPRVAAHQPLGAFAQHPSVLVACVEEQPGAAQPVHHRPQAAGAERDAVRLLIPTGGLHHSVDQLSQRLATVSHVVIRRPDARRRVDEQEVARPQPGRGR